MNRSTKDAGWTGCSWLPWWYWDRYIGDNDVNPYALGFPLCADGIADGSSAHHAQRFRQLDLIFQGAGVLQTTKSGGDNDGNDDGKGGKGNSGDGMGNEAGSGGLFASRTLPGLYEPCREDYLTTYVQTN